jgi:hypothetical protein
MADFKMDPSYLEVADRIKAFAAKYPEGSLQSEMTPLYKGDVITGWLCRAYAYRTAADERPGIGHAVEPVPGKTPYTRDSEAMNAETSAWGRAIVALGFPTKKIASANEVRERQGSGATPVEGTPKVAGAVEATNGAAPAAGTTDGAKAKRNPKYATEAQSRRLFALAKEHEVDNPTLRTILGQVTGQESTAQIPRESYDAVCVAVQTWQLAASLAEDVPFE